MTTEEKTEKLLVKSGNGCRNGTANGRISQLLSLSSSSEVEEPRLKSIVRHITHVQQSCTLLGERLINSGDKNIGYRLIANGFIHDNSKFHGIEWLYLHDDVKFHSPDLFNIALHQHVTQNPHHPEYWGKIDKMPLVYLAECVCDWHARSGEFGTDLRNFIKNHATKKFDFNLQGKVYKEIKSLVDMLLDSAFVPV